MNHNFFFKKNKYISLKQIFSVLSINQNFKNKKVYGVNILKEANKDQITFFYKKIYEEDAKNTKAGFCIVNEKNKKYLNPKTFSIISKNPLTDFYKIVSLFYPNSLLDDEKINVLSNKKKFFAKKIFIGENCLIDKKVTIGNNSKIGNNVIIKANVHIGKNCVVGSNVIIENALLGDNVIIKSGTLIGQVGFGFNFENKKRVKFPHIGRVVIENDVQIGSNCTIDRGSLTDTIIGESSSIDNQVQIAHNVKIGSFCMIAAQSGIAGSTIIGNNVKIGGQTGISGHLYIGNNVNIGGKSGVINNIENNQTVMGYPAKSLRDFLTLKNNELKKRN